MCRKMIIWTDSWGSDMLLRILKRKLMHLLSHRLCYTSRLIEQNTVMIPTFYLFWKVNAVAHIWWTYKETFKEVVHIFTLTIQHQELNPSADFLFPSGCKKPQLIRSYLLVPHSSSKPSCELWKSLLSWNKNMNSKSNPNRNILSFIRCYLCFFFFFT